MAADFEFPGAYWDAVPDEAKNVRMHPSISRVCVRVIVFVYVCVCVCVCVCV